jgi:short-subunit dehydrogenase
MELAGSRAVVTGASYGIGEAVARALAGRGVRVVLIARTDSRLKELAAELDAVALPADLSEVSTLDGLIARAETAAGGPIDLLVNNAASAEIGPFAARQADAVARELQIDLVAVLELTRQALQGMLARDRGHIVFMSSLQAAVPSPGFAPYGAAKAAISHFAAILRLELASTSVGTTVVEPGPVDTAMWERIEASPYLAGVLRRLEQTHVMTKDDPAVLAEAVADAIVHNRRHVRTPRRALALSLLSEAPRRMTELLLAGVELDSGATSETSAPRV